MRALALALVALGTLGASWLDPHATAREAARLYAAGKFDDAAAKYNEALVDDPDSALLHFNLADATYRQGKFEDTVSALGGLAGGDDPLTGPAAYNTGNAKYRLGTAAESSEPQKALGLYAEALVAYRRAMGADPADEDAKFNHEFVERKIADLKKKLEEQQQKQEQQNQERGQQEDQQPQQGQQPQPDQQQQDAQEGQEQQQDQGDQQQAGAPEEHPQDQEQGQQQQATEQPQPGEPQGEQQPSEQQAGGEVEGAGDEREMSPRDAAALLDAQRDQEVRPDEIVRKLQGARIAEPREDW